jgi:RibD C-terminal domain
VVTSTERIPLPDRTPAMPDFTRVWQAADKIVYSKSLETVSTRKTRLEREFDIAVGGPLSPVHAIRAGLVDEYHLFVAPVIIGGGRSCPSASA